jgi:hypothetical protein
LHQNVHLVELDLLLGGRRLPLRDPLPPGDFFVLVARADRRPDCDVYAWTVRQPLPTIPLPLLPEDGEVSMDLAAVFATAYERGRCARSVDYDVPPPALLGPDTMAWVRESVRVAKRSTAR